MQKLISEQRPNDGGYHVKSLVNEANERLKQIGKQGKRATIVAKKTSLSLQFTFKDGNGRPQKNVGLGSISASAKGIEEAEKIAQMVTNQLVANQFTWDWFYSLIGKDTSEQNKQLTCREMLEQFKEHFFKQRKDNKSPKAAWKARGRNLEKILGHNNKFLSLSLIKEVIEETPNNTNTRKNTIQGVTEFLKYFNNIDYKDTIKEYKAKNKPKPAKKNIPSDSKIAKIYHEGFTYSGMGNPNYVYRYPQWQFLFGLLAIYGLRIHEAWNIANWDKSVILKDGDWVAVDVDDESSIDLQRSGEDLIIPAILDSSNDKHLLCIGHETKTGYRVVAPLSPESSNWIKEFNLLQPLNLPDLKNPLGRQGEAETAFYCAVATGNWFKRKKYGFSPHGLRHAYNHRGHYLNYNHKVLADSLGHSITMNSNNYLRHISDTAKVEGMVSAINKDTKTRSRIERLEEENKALKVENTALKNQIELLETKLQLNNTYQQSKDNN